MQWRDTAVPVAATARDQFQLDPLPSNIVYKECKQAI